MLFLQEYWRLPHGSLARICVFYGEYPLNKKEMHWMSGGYSPPDSQFLSKTVLTKKIESKDLLMDKMIPRRPRGWMVYARKQVTDERFNLEWGKGRKSGTQRQDPESRCLFDSEPDFSSDWAAGM